MDTDSFFSECFKSKKNILNFTTKYFTHGCVSVFIIDEGVSFLRER